MLADGAVLKMRLVMHNWAQLVDHCDSFLTRAAMAHGDNQFCDVQ